MAELTEEQAMKFLSNVIKRDIYRQAMEDLILNGTGEPGGFEGILNKAELINEGETMAKLTVKQLTGFLMEMIDHGEIVQNFMIVDAAIEAEFFLVQPKQDEAVIIFPKLAGLTVREIDSVMSETAEKITELVNEAMMVKAKEAKGEY